MTILLGLAFILIGALWVWGAASGRLASMLAAFFEPRLLEGG